MRTILALTAVLVAAPAWAQPQSDQPAEGSGGAAVVEEASEEDMAAASATPQEPAPPVEEEGQAPAPPSEEPAPSKLEDFRHRHQVSARATFGKGYRLAFAYGDHEICGRDGGQPDAGHDDEDLHQTRERGPFRQPQPRPSAGVAVEVEPEAEADLEQTPAVPLRREGLSRRKSFWYGQLSGMVEPMAGVAGAAAVVLMKPILPYALSFAAGAMIYVVVEELIPAAQEEKHSDFATVGAMLGFAVMMTLDVALG